MAEDPVDAIKPPSSGAHNKAIQAPRALNETETFQSLTAWEVHCRNFYRKDEVFYPFVNAKLKWNSQQRDYNLKKEHETSKLKRDEDELAQDLDQLIAMKPDSATLVETYDILAQNV